MNISLSAGKNSTDCLEISQPCAAGPVWESPCDCLTLYPGCLSVHLSIQMVPINWSRSSRSFLEEGYDTRTVWNSHLKRSCDNKSNVLFWNHIAAQSTTLSHISPLSHLCWWLMWSSWTTQGIDGCMCWVYAQAQPWHPATPQM